jgi:hypothetical protein
MPPVIPVLCFLDADWPLFGAADEFRGVRLETHRSLKRLLASKAILDETRISELTTVLAAALPAKQAQDSARRRSARGD